MNTVLKIGSIAFKIVKTSFVAGFLSGVAAGGVIVAGLYTIDDAAKTPKVTVVMEAKNEDQHVSD